jgi:oligosaccharyltransferase complex subunit beta
MQARNSARFTVLGAAEMLEDTWVKAKVQVAGGKVSAAVNAAFAKEISGWTFNEVGVLKVDSVTHFLNEEGLKTPNASLTNPKIYRVKNTVVSGFSAPKVRIIC